MKLIACDVHTELSCYIKAQCRGAYVTYACDFNGFIVCNWESSWILSLSHSLSRIEEIFEKDITFMHGRITKTCKIYVNFNNSSYTWNCVRNSEENDYLMIYITFTLYTTIFTYHKPSPTFTITFSSLSIWASSAICILHCLLNYSSHSAFTPCLIGWYTTSVVLRFITCCVI